MKHALNYHLQAIKLVLSRMRQHLFSTFMICLVVGISTSLPGLFYVVVDNLSQLSNHMKEETEISLFLKLDINTQSIKEIDQILAKNTKIKKYHLVTKDEAWEKLKSKNENSSESNNILNQLNKNPLPDAFFIQAKSSDPKELDLLRNELQTIAGVDQALLNAEWVKRLSAILALGNKVILVISALLGVTLLVIIGNTVRMQIFTQKDEIEVSHLMGATRSFIRIPFLYAGMFFGLLGGLLAILLMACIIQIINTSIAQISDLYSSDFRLNLFNINLFLTLIGTSTLIGWLGSFLSVSRTIASLKIN